MSAFPPPSAPFNSGPSSVLAAPAREASRQSSVQPAAAPSAPPAFSWTGGDCEHDRDRNRQRERDRNCDSSEREWDQDRDRGRGQDRDRDHAHDHDYDWERDHHWRSSSHNHQERQLRPKVYIGGLPPDTLYDDLSACFETIGRIKAIELKRGFGFVEFTCMEDAELAVQTFDQGLFMGKQITVEISKGGGRTREIQTGSGKCFLCGEPGHWAKDCKNDPSRQPAPLRSSYLARRSASPPAPGRGLYCYGPPPLSAPARDRDPYYNNAAAISALPAPASAPPAPPMAGPRGDSVDARYDDVPRPRPRLPPPSVSSAPTYGEPSSEGTPPPPPSLSYGGGPGPRGYLPTPGSGPGPDPGLGGYFPDSTVDAYYRYN